LDEIAIGAACAVMRSGMLVHGEQGRAFERDLEQWLAVRHAILVSSGTAALHLALMALDIGPGDAVLVPDFTFPATANTVRMVGATPVLVDVDPSTYCVTPDALEAAAAAWTGPQRLRALMPVHEFGHPLDMHSLRESARRLGLLVIEDAACALGARLDGACAGTFGDVGCYSLHPRKTLTTGEGGIVVTNDDRIAMRVRRLRNHGIERNAQGIGFVEVGLNYRLTDFQAALGRAQLPHLATWIEGRRSLAAHYREALSSLVSAGRLRLPAEHPGHSWQTFMVVLADGVDRAAVIEALAAREIETNLGAQCVSALPSYANCGPRDGSPNALQLYCQGLALPFCEQYGRAEAVRVAQSLSQVLG
jgi:dTDP-4-amino-4,6-dideoxygalactose transaminase